MKHRLGTGQNLDMPPCLAIPTTWIALAQHSHGLPSLIARPECAKVIEKKIPITAQTILVEIDRWKRKAMIDSDQNRLFPKDAFQKPFGDALPRPVP